MEFWELVARERCRDTLAKYTHAGDRFQLDEFVSAFSEDGVLEIRGEAPLVGRAAILERFRGGIGKSASPNQAQSAVGAKRIVRHNVTNVRFESMTQQEASVASYFTVFTNVGADHMGRYRDRLVPVGDEWLIAHRYVSTDWHAPNSLFGEGA
jgi:SnoaL-like domain